MHPIIKSLSFCCWRQKMGIEPINNCSAIVIRKFWKLDFEWNRESFLLFMHLNIKSPLFSCWTQKMDEETISDGNDIVINKKMSRTKFKFVWVGIQVRIILGLWFYLTTLIYPLFFCFLVMFFMVGEICELVYHVEIGSKLFFMILDFWY